MYMYVFSLKSGGLYKINDHSILELEKILELI